MPVSAKDREKDRDKEREKDRAPASTHKKVVVLLLDRTPVKGYINAGDLGREASYRPADTRWRASFHFPLGREMRLLRA